MAPQDLQVAKRPPAEGVSAPAKQDVVSAKKVLQTAIRHDRGGDHRHRHQLSVMLLRSLKREKHVVTCS